MKILIISIVPTTLLAKINSFLGMSFYRIFIFGKIGLFQWPQRKVSVCPITYRRKHAHLSVLQNVAYRSTVQIQARLANWLRASLLAKPTVLLM